MKFLSLFVCLIISLTSCKHDVIVPDSPVISFQNEVQPILVANCTESGCHASSGGEFPLVSYQDALSNVTPENGRDSKLYKSITGKGESIMPPAPRPMLSDAAIRLIYIWIEQGAKNN